MRAVGAGWLTNRASAARLIVPSRATATNASSYWAWMAACVSAMLMVPIGRIALTDDTRTPQAGSMMTTTPYLITTPGPMSAVPPADRNPWLLWRPKTPAEPQRLTVAELADCSCPELCDRDHDSE